MGNRLEGEVAVVEGSRSGNGSAMALAVAREGAVVSLTRQLAVDHAPDRIDGDAIRPGFLATEMVRPVLDDPGLNRMLHGLSPRPCLGVVEDVGKLVPCPASDGAEMVTVSMQVLGGGCTAG